MLRKTNEKQPTKERNKRSIDVEANDQEEEMWFERKHFILRRILAVFSKESFYYGKSHGYCVTTGYQLHKTKGCRGPVGCGRATRPNLSTADLMSSKKSATVASPRRKGYFRKIFFRWFLAARIRLKNSRKKHALICENWRRACTR